VQQYGKKRESHQFKLQPGGRSHSKDFKEFQYLVGGSFRDPSPKQATPLGKFKKTTTTGILFLCDELYITNQKAEGLHRIRLRWGAS